MKAASAAFFMSAALFHLFGFLCFALSWLAYDHYRPWVNFHSEALALLGIGLLGASRCIAQPSRFAITPVSAFGVLLIVPVLWLQYATGISFFVGDALLLSLYVCGLASAIWLGREYAVADSTNENGLFGIFCVLWLVALCSTLIGLLQWLDLQGFLTVHAVQTDIGDRAMGNLGQPNQLATLILIGIVTLTWTFERNRIGFAGIIAGVGFLTLGLVLTQSRAGMLGALTVSVFLIWKTLKFPGRLHPRHIASWIVIYGLGLALLPHANEWLLIGDSRSMNVTVDNARATMWRQMMSGIAQSPWFGYGWNQTPAAHAAGSIAVPGSLTYSYAHNVILDVLAWNGVPLGLLITGACVWWFVSRGRRVAQTGAIYAMTALIPVVIHSMVEFPFAYSYFLLTAGLMAGIVEASHVGAQTFKVNVRWVGAMLAIWGVVGSYMVYEYLQIEEDFRVVRFENLRIGQTPLEYAPPDIWMLSQMGAMLKASRQKATPGMTPEDLENLRKASLRFPYGALALRNALALGLNGDPAGATRQMAVIRGMYGAVYYNAAVWVLREQQSKYPILSQVITP